MGHNPSQFAEPRSACSPGTRETGPVSDNRIMIGSDQWQKSRSQIKNKLFKLARLFQVKQYVNVPTNVSHSSEIPRS